MLINAGLGLMSAGATEMFAPRPPDSAEAASSGANSGTVEGSYLGILIGIAKVTGRVIDQEIKVGNKHQDEDDIVEVSCIAHNPNKYALIEKGVVLPDSNYNDFITGAIKKPFNIIQQSRLYRGETGTYGEIDFNFTEANDPRIKYYQAQVDRPNSGWQNVLLTGLNQGRIDKVMDGQYTLRVRSVAEGNRYSAWSTITFKVNIRSPIPENVSNFRATVQDRNLLLEWQHVKDLDLDKYIICYSPLKGAYWVGAGDFARTPNDFLNVPLRSGTYLVKAQDTSGGRSRVAAMVVVDGIIAKDENIIFEWSERERGWKGNKKNLFVIQDKLFLNANNNIYDWRNVHGIEDIFSPCLESGEYYFEEVIDLEEPMDVNISAFVHARGRDLNDNIYDWNDIYEVDNIIPYSDGSYGADLQMRYSQDGEVWSEWQSFVYQKVKARFFEFKTILWTEDTSYSPEIKDIEVIMDLPEYVQDGKDIDIPEGGVFVAFNKPFWRLTSLTPTAEFMVEGMSYEVSEKSQHGFYIKFFNKNKTPVAARIDYQAMGIGLKG